MMPMRLWSRVKSQDSDAARVREVVVAARRVRFGSGRDIKAVSGGRDCGHVQTPNLNS